VKNKVILCADGVCDIGEELKKKYDVHYFNFHIQIGDESFVDGLEITPEEMYAAWTERGMLPKTAAITPAEYQEFFKPWVDAGHEILHINIGSALSAAHQNCCIVAEELGNVYTIDSANLSTGIGLLVAKAGEMIKQGMGAKDIQKEIMEMRQKSHASFILDTLEFMKAGGRCSSLAAFGANLLKLKPCIEVDNADRGKMDVGKKYRGNLEKVLAEYIEDKLAGRADLDLDRVFITHSGSPQSDIELAKSEIKKYADFKEVYVTRASGTISAHCGPRTLGVLFMTK